MADDVLIQPASGAGAVPVAADEIAGTKHQRAKIQHGADGSATDVSTASPLPVAQQGAVILPTGASSSAKQDLAQARLDLLATETKLEAVRALLAADQAAKPRLYNGATYDDARGNVTGTLLASAARTATTLSPFQINHNARGVIVYLNITASSGTGGLSCRIRSEDPISPGFWVSLLLPANALAVGVFGYCVYPGAVGSGLSGVAGVPLPRNWFVQVAHADASSYTYSVSYSLIV